MREAWGGCGILGEMGKVKEVLFEPQSGPINDVKREFDAKIKGTVNGPDAEGHTGALLLAVCRGKVSEGIDFPDEAARAVVAIGIPFPALYEPQVVLKKKYNDTARSGGRADVLSGDDWYQSQAYRALNQVLGRCLRHKEDWGAIILADERFHPNRGSSFHAKAPRENISKWIRTQLTAGSDFTHFQEMLHSFVHSHTSKKLEAENSPVPETDSVKEEPETPVPSYSQTPTQVLSCL